MGEELLSGSEEEDGGGARHRTAKRQEDRVCDRRDAMRQSARMGSGTRCCFWGQRPARCATADGAVGQRGGVVGPAASKVAMVLLGPAICCCWGGEEKLGREVWSLAPTATDRS